MALRDLEHHLPNTLALQSGPYRQRHYLRVVNLHLLI
jgi:hypothetical protein